jgi:cystathionine beta-lyase family protein involved in aluminum resistance
MLSGRAKNLQSAGILNIWDAQVRYGFSLTHPTAIGMISPSIENIKAFVQSASTLLINLSPSIENIKAFVQNVSTLLINVKTFITNVIIFIDNMIGECLIKRDRSQIQGCVIPI